MRDHFIRDYKMAGAIRIDYCKSRDMIADLFTKSLPRPAFRRLRAELISDELLPPDTLQPD